MPQEQPNTDARLDNDGLWSDVKTAITLASGGRMDPLHPKVEDIHVSDIAHALARQCRYNGHTGGHYSVARHSLFVADKLDDWGEGPYMQLHGLLHDAAEAYLGDLVRPLKHGPTFGTSYLLAETQLERVIADKFGLSYGDSWPPEVMEADRVVLLEYELSGPNYRWSWDSSWQMDQDDWMHQFRILSSRARSK